MTAKKAEVERQRKPGQKNGQDAATTLKKEGDAHNQKRDYEQALHAYISALTLKPDYIDAHRAAIEIVSGHSSFGFTPEAFNEQYATVPLVQAYAARIQSLMVQRHFDEALSWCDILCELVPENGEVMMMRGMLYIATEQPVQAVSSFVHALDNDPDNYSYRNYILHSLMLIDGANYDAGVRRWITRFLTELETVDVRLFAQVWHKSLLSDDKYAPIASACAAKDEDDFGEFMATLNENDRVVFTDDFFLSGLRFLIVPDMEYEIFLTRLRRYLLENYKAVRHWAEPLVIVLAIQCFNNEYVFYQTEEEEALCNRFITAAEAGSFDAFSVALLACYKPLYSVPVLVKKLMSGFKLYLKPSLKSLAPVIRQQLKEPQEESALKKKIKVLDKIKNEVFCKVREQYEQHPYPRWMHMGYIASGADDLAATMTESGKPLDILVAGCATGYHAIGVAKKYPKAHVMGIDLSLTSLSYAARKAREYKTHNLELMQGDLLDVGKLGRKWDYIESIGVLHHMDNPEEGWAALRDVLKSDGIMRIGLYSETARRYVMMCRDYIKNENIADTDAGIRDFRHMIWELPEGHDFKNVFKYYDFYTLSMCRDLLFHVQEHCYTISKIKASLDTLDLEFTGFVSLPASVRAGYVQKFPDDPTFCNLDYMAKYEAENPDSFLSMYIFHCRCRPA